MDIKKINEIDQWIIGNYWINSEIEELNEKLSIDIGSRWATSENEREAANYIMSHWEDNDLKSFQENFNIKTYKFNHCSIEVDGTKIDSKPYHRCPSTKLNNQLIDLGYGTKREADDSKGNIKDKVAIIFRKHEPFTEQETISKRVEYIAKKGAAAIIIGDPKIGRRMEYSSVWDTRDPDSINPPLPIINTSHEHLLLLKKYAILALKAKIEVQTDFYEATTSNVITEIPGSIEDEFIVMCGHHDTVFDTPGGNDNTSGAISVIETAKSIKRTFDKFNITPKIGIRFVTLSAEEQRLQGSFYHVNNNYKKLKPRFVLNCDELSTGNLKGIVLGFPHLRNFLQSQIDSLNENLKIHVMSQLDGHSDHFPFLEAGIDASHPWRWRYHGRYPTCEYHHEEPDTFDKLIVKDLKYYVTSFTRLFTRLCLTDPKDWPKNNLTKKMIRSRLDIEKEYEIRTS